MKDIFTFENFLILVLFALLGFFTANFDAIVKFTHISKTSFMFIFPIVIGLFVTWITKDK